MSDTEADRWLRWLETASHEDVLMTLVEDGSTLLGIQAALSSARAREQQIRERLETLEKIMRAGEDDGNAESRLPR